MLSSVYLATEALLRFGSDAQKAKWLPKLVAKPRQTWLERISELKGDSAVRDIQNLPDNGHLYAAHVINDLWRLTEGNAVVVWHHGIDPHALAGLASTRTYPLRSSFRPSYNMAVNLIGTVGSHRARELLESSFAQFQADRAVVGLASQVRRNEEALEGYRTAMECHLGDFAEYAELRERLSQREKELARDGAAREAGFRFGQQ